MKDFDSNRDANWSGSGIRIGRSKSVSIGSRGMAESSALIPAFGRIKLIGKRRSGNGGIRLQVLGDDNSIFLDEKISLSSSSWSEHSFDVCSEKNLRGKVRIVRAKNSIGGVEIGRVLISSDKVRKVIRPKKAKSEKIIKKSELELLSRFSATTPVSVAIIIPYGIYGGAEVYLKSILNKLDTKMVNIELLYLSENLLKNKIENRRVRQVGVRGFPRLSSMLSTENYDVVVYYNSAKVYKLCSGLVTSGAIDSKIIEIYHSDFIWPDAVAKEKSRRGVDRIFRVSKSLCCDLSGMDKDDIINIPVGIDLELFKNRDGRDFRIENNLPEAPAIIGTVCRLSPEKNLRKLLSIAKEMKDYIFVIIGDGPERALLEALASENVKFFGHRNEIHKYYSLFDAFILTSKMEGTPISMLEAMASNLPVFVPRVGGIPDVIFDGENGFFLKDEINETVELISKNIDNVNMGKAARKYIEENHDLSEISGRFLTNLLPDAGLYSFNDGESEILPGRYV